MFVPEIEILILTYERWIAVITVLSKFELKLSLNTGHKL